MKKLSQNCKSRPSLVLMLMMFVMLLMPQMALNAQNVTITLGENPRVVIMGDSLTFNATLIADATISGGVLRVEVPAGFALLEMTPGFIAGSLSPDGRVGLIARPLSSLVSVTHPVFVRGLCDAATAEPIAANRVVRFSYFPDDVETTPLYEVQTAAIQNFSDPLLMTTFPAAGTFQTVTTHVESTGNRIIRVQQTLDGAHVNAIRVIATVSNPAIFSVSLIEGSIDGTIWVPLPAVNITETTTGFEYIITRENAFAVIGGYTGNNLGWGESIFLREVVTISQYSAIVNINYTFAIGDGVDFCAIQTAANGSVQYRSTAQLAGPTTTPVLSNISRVNPTSPTNNGVFVREIHNNSHQTGTIPPNADTARLYGIRTREAVSIGSAAATRSLTITSAAVGNASWYNYKRAFLINPGGTTAAGPVVAGVIDTIWIPMTNVSTVAGNEIWEVDFRQLTNASLQTYYEAAGLRNFYDAGRWADVPRGGRVRYGIIWNINFDRLTDPSHPAFVACGSAANSTSPAALMPDASETARLFFTNFHGNTIDHQGTAARVAPTTNSTTTFRQTGTWGYNTITNPRVFPLNFGTGTQGTLSFNVTTTGTTGTSFLTEAAQIGASGASDLWVTITLPTDMNFNSTAVPSLVIAGATVLPANIEIINPQTIRFRRASAAAYTVTIAVVANGTVIPYDQRRVNVSHELDYGRTGAVMPQFGCLTSQEIEYVVLIAPCSRFSWVGMMDEGRGFEVERTSFGYTEANPNTRVRITDVETARDLGFNLRALDAYDNFTLRAAIRAIGNTTITATEVVRLAVTWRATDNFFGAEPGRTNGASLYINDSPTGIEISPANVIWTTTGVSVDIAHYLRSSGHIDLQANDSIRLEIYGRTNANGPRIHVADPVLRLNLYEGSVRTCGPRLEQFYVYNSTFNINNSAGTWTLAHNAALNNVVVIDRTTSSGTATLPTINYIPLLTGGEFRPNAADWSDTITAIFPLLLEINSVRIETVGTVVGQTARTFTPGTEWSVEHVNGTTVLRLYTPPGDIMAELRTSGYRVFANARVINNVTAGTNSSRTITASYTTGHTTANPTTQTLASAIFASHTSFSVNITAPAATGGAHVTPLGARAEWTLRVAMNNSWANRVIPHSWLSVTVPPGVTPVELRHASNNLPVAANFYNYAPNRYWIRIGNVTTSAGVGGFHDFILSCSFANCYGTPELAVRFGMSAVDFPLDPIRGFYQFDSVERVPAGIVTLAGGIRFTPPDMAIRFAGFVNHEPNQANNTNTFCEPVRFEARFSNALNTEVGDLEVRVDLNDFELQGFRFHSTFVPQVRFGSGPWVAVQSASVNNRILSIRLDDSRALTGFGTANAVAEVRFELFMTCGVQNGLQVPVTLLGSNPCGEIHMERVVTTHQVRIYGLQSPPVYWITDLQLTIDPMTGGAGASGLMNLRGTLVQAGDAADNVYAIIDLLPNTELEEIIMPSLNFTQNGRRLTAPLPNATTIGSVFEFNLVLRPVNIEDWTTDTSYVFVRTGLSNWLNCEGMLCQILEIGTEDSVAVSMIKLEVRLSEEISARSRFGSETTERVEIEGWLVNAGDDNAGRLTMELVFFNGVYYEPVQGVVSGLSVAGVPGNDSVRFTIVANVPYFQDVCNMAVLLRRDHMVVGSFNAFLAESSKVFVGTPAYQITLQPDPICQMAVGTPIGDMPIRGYSYSWTPADFLDRDNRTQALFSHNFRDFPVFSDTTLILEKTIVRPTGCQSMDTVFVRLLALASVQELQDTTLCSGSPFRLDFYDPNNTSGNPTTFVWTTDNGPSVGLPLTGTQPFIDVANVRNFTTQPIVVNVQVTPRRNNCDGVTRSFSITVYPFPELSTPLDAGSICSGEVFRYIARSQTRGVTFEWSRDEVAGITPATGASSDNTGIINEQLFNSTADPVQVRYRITTTFQGCSTEEFVDVVVLPTPSISSTLTPDPICSGSPFIYEITSTTPGASFMWVRQINADIEERPTHGNFRISETLTNRSSVPTSVVYTIHTEANGCVSAAQEVTVIVNPLPVISMNLSPRNLAVGNFHNVENVTVTGGTVKEWVSDNPAVATVTETPTGARIDAVSEGIARITVIAESADGCENSVTFFVNVGQENIALLDVAFGQPSQVCNMGTARLEVAITGGRAPFTVVYRENGGADMSISGVYRSIHSFEVTPPANTTNVIMDVLYELVSVTDADGQDVPVRGSGVTIQVIPAAQVMNASALAGDYCEGVQITKAAFETNVTDARVSFMWTNTNPGIGLPLTGNGDLPIFMARNESFESISGTVTVTPIFADQITCPGPSESFVITIDPQPNFTVVDPRPICSGVAFDFAAQQTQIIQGLTPSNSTVRFFSDFDATTEITAPVSPTVRSTFYAQATSASGACVSVVQPIVVEVVQTPQIDPVADISLCDGGALNIVFTGNMLGASYLWTAVGGVNPNFDGLFNSGRHSITSNSLRNNTHEPQFQTIEVFPELHVDGLTCIGDTIDFVIRLNPTPRLVGNSWLPAVCNGEPVLHVLESRTTTPGVDITWARLSNTDISEFPSSGASEIREDNGLTSMSNSIVLVTYRVELTFDGCSNVEMLEMQLLPRPNVSNTVLEDRVCSGLRSSGLRLTTDVFNTEFAWTAVASSSDITGFTASGRGNIPAETLFNTGLREGTITYTIVPEFGHCSGNAVEFVIQVDPSVRIIALSEDVMICAGESVTLSVEAAGADLAYQWFRNGVAIPNARYSEHTITSAVENAGDEYFVIVSSNCGMMQSETIIVRVNVDGRLVVRWDDVILVNNVQGDVVGYQWYRNGIRIPGATGQWFHEVGGLNGIYMVALTMADGRTIFTCDTIIVLAPASSPVSLEVSPNPAMGGTRVTAVLLDRSGDDLLHGFLYTVQGMRVREFTTRDSEIFIDTHNLSPGVYILRIISEDGSVYTERIVIQQ